MRDQSKLVLTGNKMMSQNANLGDSLVVFEGSFTDINITSNFIGASSTILDISTSKDLKLNFINNTIDSINN